MLKYFWIFLIACLVTHSSAHANTLTPSQIAQFKKLPKSEQRKLAKQAGFDIDALKSAGENEQVDGSAEPQQLSKDEDKEQLPKAKILEKIKEEQSVERFSAKLFQQRTLTSSASNTVPNSYIVGVGDTFKIYFFGKENISSVYEVNSDGDLVIEGLSPTSVNGLTFGELKKVLKNKVQKEKIGVDLSVSLEEIRNIQVTVAGQVKRPGTQQVNAIYSVLDILQIAGGINDVGSAREINLIRNDKKIATVDLYSIMLNGRLDLQHQIQHGDIIFVPYSGRLVTLTGEVRSPAVFELKNSESIEQMMQFAGGVTNKADQSKAKVFTFKNGQRLIKSLDLGQEKSVKLSHGDTVNVPSASERIANRVTLIGAVTAPGEYPWFEGMKIKDIISDEVGDLSSIADLDYAIAVDLSPLKSKVDLRQFSLRAMFNGDEEQNIELRKGDAIFVFSQFETKELEKNFLSELALNEQERKKLKNKAFLDEYNKIQLAKLLDKSVEEVFSQEREVNSDKIEKFGTMDLFQSDNKSNQEYSIYSRRNIMGHLLRTVSRKATTDYRPNIVVIQGAVRFPGTYLLADDADINSLISAAGGFRTDAKLDVAQVTRKIYSDPVNIEHVGVDLTDSSFKLAPLDNVFIQSQTDLIDTREVLLQGEVKYPGKYTIARGESFDELLDRAGGLTREAFIEGIVYTRANIRKREQQNLNRLVTELRQQMAKRSMQMNETSMVSYSELRTLLNDVSETQALGRLIIEPSELLSKNADFKLKDGDAIYIPQVSNTVSVIGEVNMPATHMYKSGLSFEQYLESSGGLKQRADFDRAYIIRANGTVVVPNQSDNWFAVNTLENDIKPGDTLVVPLDTEYLDGLSLWTSATQILYQIGVAVAAIGSL